MKDFLQSSLDRCEDSFRPNLSQFVKCAWVMEALSIPLHVKEAWRSGSEMTEPNECNTAGVLKRVSHCDRKKSWIKLLLSVYLRLSQ